MLSLTRPQSPLAAEGSASGCGKEEGGDTPSLPFVSILPITPRVPSVTLLAFRPQPVIPASNRDTTGDEPDAIRLNCEASVSVEFFCAERPISVVLDVREMGLERKNGDHTQRSAEQGSRFCGPNK